eukprot:scaffold89939_cov51-Cyclotella_meneghiniana.AAC.4
MTTPPPSPYQTPRTSYTEDDYEEIYYHFDDYAAEILLSHATDIMTDHTDPEHYEAEEKILDEASRYEWQSMKRSALFGLGCGILSFGIMRWKRGGGFSAYASRSSGGYKFDPIDKNAIGSSYQQTQNYNPPKKSSGLSFHTIVSTLLTGGISLLAIEMDLFYPSPTNNNDDNGLITPPPQWISPQIPLVPGKSMVSDLLCQPLTEEFRKFPKKLWQSGNSKGFENGYNNHIALYANGGWKDSKYYNANPNASVVSLGENTTTAAAAAETNNGKKGIYEQLVLDSLQGFVINCERRARYEKKLRRARGASKGSPVVIPVDGVPADEDLELDDIYLVDERENSHDNPRFGL